MQTTSSIAHAVSTLTDGLIRRVLIASVVLYRRWLSRFKATRCAHGVTHGVTCSTAALRALREYELSRAIMAIRAQFAACAFAHSSLSHAASEGPPSAGIGAQENECCKVIVEIGVRRTMTVALSLCLGVKLMMALAYHSGSMGGVGGWVFEWLGPSLIGAAGSELWPLVVVSFACDIAILAAIRARRVPEGALGLQLFLSLMVLFLENFYMMAIGSFSGGLASLLAFESLDLSMDRITRHLGVIWFPKKVIIAIAWVAVTYIIWIGTIVAKDDE
ncbi:MAG: membrane protein insertion efficiency factor YidD [Phycisphaerales bacterium]|nr:membrane protein insertion efficiency factor YidD [Phycisphaerales bacterium]